MTSPARVLAVLDLFSSDRPVWSADEINEVLGYTRATGYRYVRELVQAGFLQKAGGGLYALGGRIIELDYQIRHSDPLLLAAMPAVAALAARTGFDAVLSVLFGGAKVIDIHRVNGNDTLEIAYGRGRARPLFRGSAPKVLLAGLPRAVLVRLYRAHAAEISEAGMGDTQQAFIQYLSAISQDGFYLSLDELRTGLGAAGVPVRNAAGEVIAALSLVGRVARLKGIGVSRLQSWVQESAAEIQARFSREPRRGVDQRPRTSKKSVPGPGRSSPPAQGLGQPKHVGRPARAGASRSRRP